MTPRRENIAARDSVAATVLEFTARTPSALYPTPSRTQTRNETRTIGAEAAATTGHPAPYQNSFPHVHAIGPIRRHDRHATAFCRLLRRTTDSPAADPVMCPLAPAWCWSRSTLNSAGGDQTQIGCQITQGITPPSRTVASPSPSTAEVRAPVDVGFEQQRFHTTTER